MSFGTAGRRVSLKFTVSMRKVRKHGEIDQGHFQRAFVSVMILAGNRIQASQVKKLWQ